MGNVGGRFWKKGYNVLNVFHSIIGIKRLLALPSIHLNHEWHHWRQFIRLHAASSGATKDFELLFFTYALVLPETFTTAYVKKVVCKWCKYLLTCKQLKLFQTCMSGKILMCVMLMLQPLHLHTDLCRLFSKTLTSCGASSSSFNECSRTKNLRSWKSNSITIAKGNKSRVCKTSSSSLFPLYR